MFQQDYELSEEEKTSFTESLDGDIALRKIEEFADPSTAVKLQTACNTGVCKTRIRAYPEFFP